MSEEQSHIFSKLGPSYAELILNRPDSRNALSKEMWLAIPEKLQSLQEQGASIVVIRGSGGIFAAGADITEMQELETFSDAKEFWDVIAAALDFLYSFELPTIAAIDGACLGGGCLLACACDLRYASERAVFSVPIAKLGIVLDDANLGRLAALVGVSRAKEIIYRAKRLSAAEALSWGLVNEVFSQESFQEKLDMVLAEIKQNSAVSIREAKASFARFLAFAFDPHNQQNVLKSYIHPESQERIQRALKKD